MKMIQLQWFHYQLDLDMSIIVDGYTKTMLKMIQINIDGLDFLKIYYVVFASHQCHGKIILVQITMTILIVIILDRIVQFQKFSSEFF